MDLASCLLYFEVLRHIYDKAGCPTVVVGLPRIAKVIDLREKFASRVGLRMQFQRLKPEEVLDTVLPNLVFPHWKFDPHKESDRKLGELIWQMVSPSLRKLRNLLQIASQIAEVKQKPYITKAIINEAFGWSASQQDKLLFKKRADPQRKDQMHASVGDMEHISERRQDAKRTERSADD